MQLLNFNLRLDLIKTLFFKILTYFDRSSGKSKWIDQVENQVENLTFKKKKSAQLVHFYRFYGHFMFYPKTDLHNFLSLKIAVKPVKMDQLS